MIWPSAAKALSKCAALRSWKASKLPRKVFPSMATAIGVPVPSIGTSASPAACARNARSISIPSRPRKMKRTDE